MMKSNILLLPESWFIIRSMEGNKSSGLFSALPMQADKYAQRFRRENPSQLSVSDQAALQAR
jgi:hypothetical protein